MRKAKISFALTLITSTVLLFLPAYSSTIKESPVSPNSKPTGSYFGHRTLASVNGPKVYVILAIPVVLASLPLLLRNRAARIVSALLLSACVIIGIAGVGPFYIPSAMMMILAASAKPVPN